MIYTFSEVLEIHNGKNQRNVENKNGNYPIYGSGGIIGFADKYLCDEPAVIIGRKGSINNPIFVDKPFWNVDTAFALVPNSSLLDVRYLYYFCLSYNFNVLSTTVTIPSLTKFNLLKVKIEVPSLEEQKQIVHKLDKIEMIIGLKERQLKDLEGFIRSRFIEMFGDPIINSLKLPCKTLSTLCDLKAGIFTSASEIHEFQSAENPYPCYGGNGIRGFVDNYTQEGKFPIIGRQGALCGNVQLASGKFRNTEHAVIVKPKVNLNVIWLYEALILENLNRLHTGAAQPGLAVNTLNQINIPVPSIIEQDKYEHLFIQLDKSKLAVQKSLDELKILKKSLMQTYFG